MPRKVTGAVLLAFALLVGSARATVIDTNFTESNFVFAVNEITGVGWAPDASQRLFLSVKGGTVRIVKNGVLLPTPFATISPVYTTSECGVIGLAFDPDFGNSGFVYFFVTVSGSEQQIIRYTANGDVGTDKTTIVSGLPTRGQNHNGGGIGFGPDGKVYWSIGDNGDGSGVDGDLTTLAAKVGRANRDGTVPNDNPFVDGNGPNEERIWARGFRNPFTLTFQPSTERLWVNTVGTNYEQVFVPGRGDHAGYDNYENNQPAGFLAPVIVYRTNGSDTRQITSAVRSGGVATFTLSGAYPLRVGNTVTIAGTSDASFDGQAYVTAASATEFSVAQAGPGATATGGTAATFDIGGAITGGTFWDSSAVPAAYRGNYFFGDFNTGRVERVTLDSGNTVTSVRHFATSIGTVIDMDVGPDGALYYARYPGQLMRTSFNATGQGLVVSRLHRRGIEGGSVFFHVRLAMAPSGDVTVSVGRSSGDSDISVATGGSLTFTTANWSAPQPVSVAAAQDTDTVDDAATITVSASGLASEDVIVRMTDDDGLGLVIATSSLTIDEGDTGTFDVSLNGPPSGSVTVNVSRQSGDASVTVSAGAQLTFSNATWDTPQTVTIAAAQDGDSTNETATIGVSAAGLASRQVDVSVVDDDARPPDITSTPVTAAVDDAPYTYDVAASGQPAPSFSLDLAPSGMSIDAGSGVIVWTPANTGQFAVTVRAANGVAPDDTQSFTIQVAADLPPRCTLTSPQAGAVLQGTNAEFFGDVRDDVGTTHAQFSVDGTVRYDDVNVSGHYHFGGTHLMFDTTAFADGAHVLRLTGFDTEGQTCTAEANVTIDNLAEPDAGASGGAPGSGGAGAGGTPPAAGGTAGATGSGGASEAGAVEAAAPPDGGGPDGSVGPLDSGIEAGSTGMGDANAIPETGASAAGGASGSGADAASSSSGGALGASGGTTSATGGVFGAAGRGASAGGGSGGDSDSGSAGGSGSGAGSSSDDGGCGCRIPVRTSGSGGLPALLAALAVVIARGRRAAVKGRVVAGRPRPTLHQR